MFDLARQFVFEHFCKRLGDVVVSVDLDRDGSFSQREVDWFAIHYSAYAVEHLGGLAISLAKSLVILSSDCRAVEA